MQGAHTKFIKRSHIDKFVEYYPMILQAKKDLEEWGFEFLPLPKPSGIVFAITGPLPLDRVEAAQLLENHGWEWSASGVTKACNLLITNLTTPTNKYKKAVERGIEIITWDEALNRIGVKADEDW
jgi:NAD-dependent DNA ligase